MRLEQLGSVGCDLPSAVHGSLNKSLLKSVGSVVDDFPARLVLLVERNVATNARVLCVISSRSASDGLAAVHATRVQRVALERTDEELLRRRAILLRIHHRIWECVF